MIKIKDEKTDVFIFLHRLSHRDRIKVHEINVPTQQENTKVCIRLCVCVALEFITEITLAWEGAPRQETAIQHLLTYFHWILK